MKPVKLLAQIKINRQAKTPQTPVQMFKHKY